MEIVMNVSLTPELERLVNRKVKSGMYQTASEVVREGLRLLKERDEFDKLRAAIQVGIDEIDRGEYQEYDDHTIEDLARDIKRRGRRRLSALEKTRSG